MGVSQVFPSPLLQAPPSLLLTPRQLPPQGPQTPRNIPRACTYKLTYKHWRNYVESEFLRARRQLAKTAVSKRLDYFIFCTIINTTTYAVPSSASRPPPFIFSRHPSFSPLFIYRAACAVRRPFLRRFSKASGLGEVPVPRLPPARACRRPAGCAAEAAAAAAPAAAAGTRVALQS